MYRNLLWKEILGHLRSSRFVFSIVVAVVLMLSSTWVLLANYQSQLDAYFAFTNEHTRQIGSYETGAESRLGALSMGGRILDRRPPVLSFLVTGAYQELPKSYWLSNYDGPSPETNLVENGLRRLFELLDLRFVIGVVFSLLALVLSYDAINGERQAGTLRLIFSNPVSIREVLLSKWISTNTVLGVAFVVALLGSLVFALLSPAVTLGADAWLRLVLFAAVSLLYLAVFVTLGILLSTLFASPASSIAVSLLLWVGAVFVLPGASPYLGAGSGETPSYVAAVSTRQDDLGYNYRQIRQGFLDDGHDWQSASELTNRMWKEEVEPRRATHLAQANQEFLNRKLEIFRRGRNLARISPYGSYSFAITELAETGISEQLRFEREVERYRQRFHDFIAAQEEAGSDQEVTVEEIPVFEYRASSLEDVLSAIAVDVGGMALLVLLIFALTYLRMLRYDVR